MAKKILEDQRCPHCYSEKFEIDIEPALKKQSDRKGKGDFSNRFNKQFGFGSDKNATEEEPNIFEFTDDDMMSPDAQFRQNQQRIQNRAYNVSGTVVRRHKMSVAETKLSSFDLAVVD
jgi:hypothetical protein